MKPKIILINGLIASGKSTLCSALIEKLNDFVFVDRAYIKETMLRRVKKNDKPLARKLSKKAVYVIVKGLMKDRYNLLLQEFSLGSLKKHLAGYIEKYGYEVHGFYLACSLEEAKKRDFERKGFERPEAVENIHNEHEEFGKEGVIIDTEKCNLEQTLKIVYKEIGL